MSKITDSMSLHDRAIYEKKLEQMHIGPCSSPNADSCPCPLVCPLHGRCCDCIRHHREEGRKKSPDDYSWIPNCLKIRDAED